MKLITTTLTLLTLVCFTATAQVTTNDNGTIVVNGITYAPVNTNDLPSLADAGGKEYGGYEVTFGGGGSTIKGNTEIGLDVSLSSNPFKKLPQLWIGVAQGVYWEPSFSGTTDVFADWNTHLFNEFYLNTGWSVGAIYDSSEAVYRTGPEISLQYYTSDNAFIYAGVNYDFMTKGDDGIRYSFGIGLSF